MFYASSNGYSTRSKHAVDQKDIVKGHHETMTITITTIGNRMCITCFCFQIKFCYRLLLGLRYAHMEIIYLSSQCLCYQHFLENTLLHTCMDDNYLLYLKQEK